MRIISDNFICELKAGLIQPLLDLIRIDYTLCLEIREHYINIYYRGGNILRIDEKQGAFCACFDRKYLDNELTRVTDLPNNLNGSRDVEAWIDAIPFMKHEMDVWFGNHPKNEREFQQLMVRENNYGKTANGTDYFICDIEYANYTGRFDLIAVHWPSSSTGRKNNCDLRLAFIEMKYLDNALTGAAGLGKHIEDINTFLGESANLGTIKKEMKAVFNQKQELGLVNNQKSIESICDDKPEFILALVNHDPGSTILRKELANLPDCPNAEIKVATSNFMGYGLYSQSIYGLDEFLDKFEVNV